MTRPGVTGFLLLYFGVLWCGVVFRIDRFPLTWAPMYSTVSPPIGPLSRRIVDREEMKKGLVVTRADGSEQRVNRDDLNIPKWNFYRVYYQRAFGGGPPKYTQLGANLGAFNRWVRGLEAGERAPEPNWERRLFYSLNKTLGRAPGDPFFLVRIRAWEDRANFRRDPLGFVDRSTRHADLNWRQSWAGDFDSGLP